MSSSSKDYYAILGVNAKASGEDIKKRYRELARRYHPDVNPKPEAAQKIKDINEAYATLGDTERRATYDADRIFQARTAAPSSTAPRQTPPSQPPRPAPTSHASGSARPFRPAPPTRPGSGNPYANRSASGGRNDEGGADADWDALLYGRRQGNATARPPGSGNAARPASSYASGQAANPADRQRAQAQRRAAEREGDIKRLVGEAQLAFINRHYAEAQDFCRQVIRLDSRNALAYELLGDAARKQGQTEEAIQAYTLAVQLNPRNQNVQANLDRLMGMGGKTAMHGPTLARAPAIPLAQRLGSDVIVNGAGAASLVGLGASLSALYMFPGTTMIAGLSLNLFVVLIISGILGGVLLALYGGMRPQSQELAARADMRSPVPLNGILALLAFVWFFLSLLAYIVVGATRNRISASVLRAYGLTLIMNVGFVLVYHPLELAREGGFSVPTAFFAGNLLFPAVLLGWKLGDTLRLGRFGGM